MRKRRRDERKKTVGFKTDSKDDASPSPTRSASPGRGFEEDKGDEGQEYSDEDEEGTGVTIKGAAQYLAYQPKEKKAVKSVNEEKYFKNILRLEPQIERATQLKQRKNKLYADFKHNYKNNNNAFLND